MINMDYLIALSGIVFVLMHYSKELVLKPAKARFNVPDNYYVYGLTLLSVAFGEGVVFFTAGGNVNILANFPVLGTFSPIVGTAIAGVAVGLGNQAIHYVADGLGLIAPYLQAYVDRNSARG